MNFRDPGTLAIGGLGAVLLFLPGRGLLGPVLWLGRPNFVLLIPLAILIFCVVYFGTLRFWKLLTGDPLPKPIPAVLALWLGIRLTVDCARMMLRW
jgi:hypothetical protein